MYPEDTAIDELISITKKIFSAQIPHDKADAIANDYWVKYVDNAPSSPVTAPAMFVATAACSAVLLATLPPESYEEDPYNGRLDTDLDPWEFEPDYFCASAYCTKLNWDESSEAAIAKRREYWEWYLTKAVPHALETYQELYKAQESTD